MHESAARQSRARPPRTGWCRSRKEETKGTTGHSAHLGPVRRAPKGDFRIRKGVNAARWDGLREEPAPPGSEMTADRTGAPRIWEHRFERRLPIRSVGWGEGTLRCDAPCPFSPFVNRLKPWTKTVVCGFDKSSGRRSVRRFCAFSGLCREQSTPITLGNSNRWAFGFAVPVNQSRRPETARV